MAGRCGDRVVLNLVSAKPVAAAVRSVQIPAAVWVVAGVDPTEEGWDQVRREIALYLGAPGYSSALAEAGLADLVETARAGAPVSDLARLVTPDHLQSVAAIGSTGGDRAAGSLRGSRSRGDGGPDHSRRRRRFENPDHVERIVTHARPFSFFPNSQPTTHHPPLLRRHPFGG